MSRHAHDRNLHVEFYMGAVMDGPRSEASGHPVFMDKPFIRIHVPGDQNTVIDTKVTPYYQERFKDEFRSFMAGSEAGIAGWRLKEWPVISAAQVKNLEFLSIHTVEQLAGLSDTQVQKVGMGGTDLRAKAQAALAAATDGAVPAAQAAENKRLQDEIEALKAMIAGASTEERRPPGRPRKETSEA